MSDNRNDRNNIQNKIRLSPVDERNRPNRISDTEVGGLKRTTYDFINTIVDVIVGEEPETNKEISKNSLDCHNKYVKGQKNEHGHIIYDIYSDHPNWDNYTKCLGKTKKKQEIARIYGQKRRKVSLIVMAGLVGGVLYGVYWLGTKNKIKK